MESTARPERIAGNVPLKIQRDPERNQQRILRAATAEFARYGLGYFYLSNRYTLSTIFRRPLLAPRHQAERLKHMISLVLGYLRK